MNLIPCLVHYFDNITYTTDRVGDLLECVFVVEVCVPVLYLVDKQRETSRQWIVCLFVHIVFDMFVVGRIRDGCGYRSIDKTCDFNDKESPGAGIKLHRNLEN